MAEQGIPIIGPLLNKIIGTRNDRFVKRYTQRVEAINALEERTRRMTDDELRGKLGEFRERYKGGEREDQLIVDVFAIAREAMDRSVGIRNIFNPKHAFDPAALPPAMRDVYARIRAEAESLPPLIPATFLGEQGKAPAEGVPDEGNDFLGCTGAIPGWMRVEIPPELYEAVREIYPESRPPFRARPFDVQLIGGMVLAGGKIAEMRTGEGKTIVAPLACYLACIERYKVHVVTVNDYLVQRDRDWTFPYFRALGLTVGAIHPMHMQPEDAKRRMYRCDVVYGTTAEFGFDYLRDNMKRSVEQQVQRRREFAVVDEVDSILIDEARTPLIISGPAHDDQPRYEIADKLARHLVEKQKPWQEQEDRVQKLQQRIKGLEGDIRQVRDKGAIPGLQEQLKLARTELPALEAEKSKYVQFYELEMDRKACYLTHDGIAEAQRAAAMGSFYVDENMDLPHLLEQSLRAHVVYQRDKDYVIMPVPDQMTGRTEPTVVIVDVFTGRPMIGRQWSDGLHQAVECKEKVPIKQETQTVATITIQNFFKMYKRLAGMTGTADTEAQEFHDIYKLDVVSIPTNKPVIRRDFDDLMFLRARDKWEAITDEIKTFHDVGRPVLVGTTSVEKSEMLSQALQRKHGIKHEVLNAKQHERESLMIENAGHLGQVMIATNMAGRGTDIKLGPISKETLLDHWLRRGLAPRTVTVDSTEDQLREGVFRKIAPKELGAEKRNVESMAFAELEMELLRNWAATHTWLGEKSIASASRDELLDELDKGGRFLLHRIRWFTTIEEMGGLHVIGTERHEARRIDNQLRGRGGRQGDKGSSRFYVSLEDDLMKLFAGETQMKILARLGMKEGDSIEHPWLSKSVQRAQKKVEERNFQIRKNILEYDEVMEHQRQTFYGLRQRVLEGRDVKGLIFDYIRDAVEDGCAEYLGKDYPVQCVAEFAKQKLECSVPPERLRGMESYEMEKRIRDEAKADVASMIDVTLGEFIPAEGSEVEVDFDAAGLVGWAKNRFGVDLDPRAVEEGKTDRAQIKRMLGEAAEHKIEETDLAGLEQYLAPNYGAQQLGHWFKNKFGIDVSADEIIATQQPSSDKTAADVLMAKAHDLYEKREVEYPVEFAMEMTMALMRSNPQAAASQVVSWANRRYSLGMTEDDLRKTPPLKFREKLLEASKAFVSSGRLEEEIKEAIAKGGDDEALDAHLQKRFGIAVPDWMRFLRGQEREDAIRGRIESIQRAELLYFEQTILLDTLDHNWKDHLYAMDQLRDTIGLRGYSQQDPRTEYKREGSRMFHGMMETLRDRITDYIFKVRLSMAPPTAPPPRQTPRPAPATLPAGGEALPGDAGDGTVAQGALFGPGLSNAMTPPPPPASEQSQRDLEAAQQAGSDPTDRSAAAKAQRDAAQQARSADRQGGKERKR